MLDLSARMGLNNPDVLFVVVLRYVSMGSKIIDARNVVVKAFASIASSDQLVQHVKVVAFVHIMQSEHNVLSVKVVAFVSITSADQCAECGGCAICSHGIQKQHCRECGNSFCEHNKLNHRCPDCNGVDICKAHGPPCNSGCRTLR